MKVIPLTTSLRNEDVSTKEADHSANCDGPLHRHKEIQITLIVKGEGTLTVGNYSQLFKAGDVYVIGAKQAHVFTPMHGYSTTGEVEAQAIHLYFDFKRIPETFFLLQELSAIRKFISSCTEGLQLAVEHEAEATILIRSINEKANLERLLGLFEIFHFFSRIIIPWKPLSGSGQRYALPKSQGKRMNDVFKYTLDNYAENITLNTIASVAHITPHAFCKYFKQHTRKTYNNFLNEVRVNEACKKIISGSYDGLSAIAYKTGFKGASNFNRVFKKTTGMSPSDYKREFRKSFF